MMRAARAAFCLAALLMPLGAGAEEAPATEVAGALVAVLPPDFSANVSEGARTTLVQRLVEGLKVARFNVVSGEELQKRLGADGAALGCRTPDCYPALARRLRVAYLVVVTVGQVERNYDITLVLLRGRSGEKAAETRERCDICGIEEVGEKMGLAASSLRTKLEALMVGPARLAVRSSPPGAYVSLDGKEIGRTPLEREVPGGQHTLRLRHRGHIAAERTVTLVPEIAETVDVTLLRAAATFPYATIGWTALCTGVLAIGAGAAMVAIDGRELSCSAARQDAFGHCPKVRNTRALGAALAGVGAALATGGGLFLWLASDRGGGERRAAAPRWRAGVQPLLGGAQLALDGRF
ncbi:MAG: PEGA domain-containing protein [Deltaproteobacteria bacterium]|nr:PEGA domain-containing protein [Deltaproteobacteria bacterium]